MSLKLYSIKELSEILNLHQKTILRFIKEGKLKAQKIGRTWKVSEDNLKLFCHGELSTQTSKVESVNYTTLSDRISISAVIEIKEQNSEEATRISNSIMAMLNSERSSDGKTHFEFFYYPEIEKAKYVFYGTPDFISRIIDTFKVLSNIKE